MKRRTFLVGLTVLSSVGGVTALLPSNDLADNSPNETTQTQDQQVKIRVLNTLTDDAQALIRLQSAGEKFLTANITSTPDETQEVSIPIPTGQEYNLNVDVNTELDSPEEVTFGRKTVRASGSSLSSEETYGFTHPDMTVLRITIGGEPFLDIEQVE